MHTVLSLSSWQGAKIGKLIDEELAPYATGEQIKLSGPEVRLQPATAQTVALALHELVTNSAKYGALSALTGRLSIGWEDHDDLLRIVWVETGGPPVEKPASRGFGTTKRDRQHRVATRRQGGIRLASRRPVCRLSVPLSPDGVGARRVEDDAHAATRRARTS